MSSKVILSLFVALIMSIATSPVQSGDAIACNGFQNPAEIAPSCVLSLCGENEFVSGRVCTPCDSGYTNSAGDDPNGSDTACDDINECSACPGSYGSYPQCPCGKFGACTNTPGSSSCEFQKAIVTRVVPGEITISGGYVEIWGRGMGLNKNDLEAASIGPLKCLSLAWDSAYPEEKIECQFRAGSLADRGEHQVSVTTASSGSIPGFSTIAVVVSECLEIELDCAGVCNGGCEIDECGLCCGDGTGCGLGAPVPQSKSGKSLDTILGYKPVLKDYFGDN